MDFSNILELDTINHIKYKNNVVTGVIATDNGNGTYDVYIAGADVAYPNVPTTMPEPDFSIDDPVEIAIEYGNKEMPILIGHAKKIVQEFVEDVINVLVSTLDAYSIAATSCYFEGRVGDIEGYENVIRRGFYYGTSTGYGSDIYSTGSFAAGSYNEQVTGLVKETTYHFQAYVHDADNDVHTGDDKPMTTSALTHKVYTVCDNGSGTYYIKSYTDAGVLLDTWTIEATENIGNAICVDVNENVYTITGNQHSIKKRNSAGTLTLTKTETNWLYNIAVAPNGYIYTEEVNASGNPIVCKRNVSDLVVVDTMILTVGKDYYGLTIDSDGIFYLVNNIDQQYESWNWDTGIVASWAGEYTFASLATLGANLANVDWLAHAILTPKDLSGGETDYELTDINYPGALGTFGIYYLASGYDDDSKVSIGKYDSGFTKVWVTQIPDSGSYGYGSIAAYPF